MHWTRTHAGRLTTAAKAAASITSGESLGMGMLTNHPYEFEEELVARASELNGVRIYHHLSLFPWWAHAAPENIRQTTLFATPVDRPAIDQGHAGYLPYGSWATEHVARDHPPIDTMIVSLSPPDDDGEMSFGPCLWLNRELCERAKRVYAEIDPGFIRTAGDNRIHVSEIDAMWLREPMERPEVEPEVSPEMNSVSEAVCRLVSDNLIDDGDCLQIGTGDVTRRLPYFLGEKKDLGIQTELMAGGIVPLIERGVITGAKKQVATGKAVGCALVAPPEEIKRADGHPSIELWDFTRTDDLRTLTRNHHFKAVNNALEVDITGQVNAESIGPRVYSGPGGQPVFAIAASYSQGGASIVVLPSSSIVDGVRKSRIVASFRPGTSITVPRSFIDYVVTEYGIARLSGKSLQERIRSMLSITHPELQDEVAKEARALYSI